MRRPCATQEDQPDIFGKSSVSPEYVKARHSKNARKGLLRAFAFAHDKRQHIVMSHDGWSNGKMHGVDDYLPYVQDVGYN